MKEIVVLAMHGMIPKDFPKHELAEYFKLHLQLELMSNLVNPEARRRYEMLDSKLRTCPRTADNDPYKFAAEELAKNLQQKLGIHVLVGYNEFCAPSLDETFAEAANQEAEKVIVVTNMMTQGGEHSEVDIPAAIQRARKTFPNIAFSYLWPFDVNEVANFLANIIKKNLDVE